MKIVAVGRNYAEHARELGNEVPADPVLFLMPESAMLTGGKSFVYPSFSTDVHYEIEVVLRICRLATGVPKDEARNYYDAMTVGIDFTARDVQSILKSKGLPWEIAKAFDGSAPVGEFIGIPAAGPIEFSLTKNGMACQRGTTSDMLHDFDSLISSASIFFTLSPGDLVFTGTPSGVGPASKGDLFEGFIGSSKLLSCRVV